MSTFHRRCFVVVLFVLLGQVMAQEPARLTLMVGMTPQELASFRPALEALDAAHSGFVVDLEPVPQQSFAERANVRLASGTLPDVVRMDGLVAQRLIRSGAFLELTALPGFERVDLDDYFPGVLAPYRTGDALWALADTASPTMLFYDRAKFDAAGVAYPTDAWTYEDMRQAAVRLTRDAAGRSPLDDGFDPARVVQWGWNNSLTMYWQRDLVQALGADWCVDPLCTTFDATAPDVVAAVQWWADLVQVDHAGLYAPYSGAQTGIPGDAFQAGVAAMGYGGFFAIGQLNAIGGIDYDVAPPLLGLDGRRRATLSINGYAIAAGTEHPLEAMELLLALTSPDFLAETWGGPGHAVPARRSAAPSVVDPARPPANQEAALVAMEVGSVFHPFAPSAFEAYARTVDLFAAMMRGDLPVPEALAEIERVLNETLAGDRFP